MKVYLFYQIRNQKRKLEQPIMYAYTKNKEYAKMFEYSRNMRMFYRKEVKMDKKQFLHFQDKYQDIQLDCYKYETVPSRPIMKYDVVTMVCTRGEAITVYTTADNIYNAIGNFTIREALFVKKKYKDCLGYLSYYSALMWNSDYDTSDSTDYAGLNIFNDKNKRVDKFRLFLGYFGYTMEGYYDEGNMENEDNG